MRSRRLGKDGPHLSMIGFGAWAIGGPWEFGWGEVDDNESIKAIHRALDLGVNWIDTAAVYGLGHSEEVVAQALKGIRQNVFVATKCGMVWDDRRNVARNLKPESIRKEIEGSLRRLRTDCVDLYQIHWPDPDTPAEDSWKTMEDLVREGKARYIGVCNYSVSELETCRAVAKVQSLQPPYNMLKRDAEAELFPYCVKNDVGVVAYSPMASGLLTGKFDFNKLADDDWRRKSPRFNEDSRRKTETLLHQLASIAEHHRCSIGAIAVAWVLKNDTVTSAIVGARKSWQIEDVVSSANLELSPLDVETIDRALQNI